LAVTVFGDSLMESKNWLTYKETTFATVIKVAKSVANG
jgi:hypothetical protein